MIGFRKTYALRRFGEPEEVRGYPAYPATDTSVLLDVQPLRADELAALPEGKRSTKFIKGYGSDLLTPADQAQGVAGDRLFYGGRWYECVSCVRHGNTPLAHYKSEFELVGEGKWPENLAPPEVGP